jgi:hypothetical protein
MSLSVLYALVRRLAEASLAPIIVGPLKSTEIRYKGAGADLALEKDNLERDLGSQSLQACQYTMSDCIELYSRRRRNRTQRELICGSQTAGTLSSRVF